MESKIFPEVHSERQWVQAAAKGNPDLGVRKNILLQGTGGPRVAVKTPVWEESTLELDRVLRKFDINLNLSRKLN